MSQLNKMFWLAGASVIALGILGSPAANAADTSAAPAAGATPAGTVEEVIVTATKREESLQKVPLSITALSGDQISARGVESFAELSRLVPGVVQSGIAEFSKFTIRGIETTNTTSSNGIERTVAVYLNDLPLTSFSVLTPEINPFDMSRVEVLRGPQGTLFGSSTMAGAVRYITNTPNLQAYDAAVQADVGITGGDSYRRRFNGMANIPVIQDKLAVRAVGYIRDEDGYVTNILLHAKHPDYVKAWGGRISAEWQVSDDFKLTAMATNDSIKNGDQSKFNPSLGTNIEAELIPYTAKVDLGTYSLAGSYSLPWATVESTTTYARDQTAYSTQVTGVKAYPYYINEQADAKTFTEDFRLVSKGDHRFSYVVGAFYLNQKSPFRDVYNSDANFVNALHITGLPQAYGLDGNGPYPAVNTFDDRERDSMEAAVYGEVTVHITDKIHATVGLRESEFKYSDNATGKGYQGLGGFAAAVAAGGNQTVAFAPTPAVTLTTGLHAKLTQKYSLNWEATPDLNFYILASEGFRRGQPNAYGVVNGGVSRTNPNDPTVIPVAAAPDGLWNYELGAKTRWFEGRLQANATLYYIRWTNMQVNLTRQTDPQSFIGNAGSSTSKGVELELEARPVRTIDIGANITVQDAKITSLTAQEALISGAVLGGRLASPDFQIYVHGQKDWEIGNGADVFARIDYQHVGAYPNAFPHQAGSLTTPAAGYAINPAYDNLNLSLGWQKDRLKVVLYGENVANNLGIIYISPGTSVNSASTLRPRTIGLRLNWKY